MTIPKILYHGTTKLRWKMMKASSIMNSHMPKLYKIDQNIHGYLFFTDNPIEAITYGLNTFLTDIRMSESQLPKKWLYYAKGHESMRDTIVLRITTSQLRDGFEIDPEYHSISVPGDKEARQKFLAEGNLGALELIEKTKGVWYRYKGDIPFKYTSIDGTIRYAWYVEKHPELIDALNKGIDECLAGDAISVTNEEMEAIKQERYGIKS